MLRLQRNARFASIPLPLSMTILKIILIETMNPHWLDLAKEWYPWMKEKEQSRDASTTEECSLRQHSSSAQHDNTKNYSHRNHESTLARPSQRMVPMDERERTK